MPKNSSLTKKPIKKKQNLISNQKKVRLTKNQTQKKHASLDQILSEIDTNYKF